MANRLAILCIFLVSFCALVSSWVLTPEGLMSGTSSKQKYGSNTGYKPVQQASVYKPPKPAVSTQYKPAVSNQYKPAVSTQYKPAVSTQYKPAVSTQYKPAVSTQYKPAVSSGVHHYNSPAKPVYTPVKPAYNQQYAPQPAKPAYTQYHASNPVNPTYSHQPAKPVHYPQSQYGNVHQPNKFYKRY